MAPDTPPTPPNAGLLGRLVGVMTSPRATFAQVAAEPRWFGALAVVCVTGASLVGGFLSTDVGQQAWLDQAVRASESFGGQVTDEQYQGFEKLAAYAGYLAAGQMLIVAPVMMLILAGLLFAIFSAALGGEASFRQVFAVVAHTGAVSTLQQLFTVPLNYARESMSSATNVAVFLPMLDEAGFAARLLGAIDLFLVWWVFVLSVGLAVLYRRKTRPIALALLAVYGVIAAIIAFFTSRAGGS